jgi:hypothetical protein
MLGAPTVVWRVKFRGSVTKGDLPHVCLGCNVISVLERLTSLALLRESQETACL